MKPLPNFLRTTRNIPERNTKKGVKMPLPKNSRLYRGRHNMYRWRPWVYCIVRQKVGEWRRDVQVASLCPFCPSWTLVIFWPTTQSSPTWWTSYRVLRGHVRFETLNSNFFFYTRFSINLLFHYFKAPPPRWMKDMEGGYISYGAGWGLIWHLWHGLTARFPGVLTHPLPI